MSARWWPHFRGCPTPQRTCWDTLRCPEYKGVSSFQAGSPAGSFQQEVRVMPLIFKLPEDQSRSSSF